MSLVLNRQGDVLVFTKDKFTAPKGLKFKPVKVLHKGENNDHFFKSGEVLEATGELNGKPTRFLRVKKKAVLSHGGKRSKESADERHDDVVLKPGDYWTKIQFFFDHVKGLKREVID